MDPSIQDGPEFARFVGLGEMAPWVRLFAGKHEDLCLILNIRLKNCG